MTKLTYDNIFEAVTDNSGDAADLKFRSDLLLVLRGIFESRSWKQSEIMQALEIPQPRASELTRGLVDKFSSDKLIGYLAALGYRFTPSYEISRQSEISVSCKVSSA